MLLLVAEGVKRSCYESSSKPLIWAPQV